MLACPMHTSVFSCYQIFVVHPTQSSRLHTQVLTLHSPPMENRYFCCSPFFLMFVLKGTPAIRLWCLKVSNVFSSYLLVCCQFSFLTTVTLCLRGRPLHRLSTVAYLFCRELLRLRRMLLLFITVILGFVASRFAFSLLLLQLSATLCSTISFFLSTLSTRSSFVIVLSCQRLKRFFCSTHLLAVRISE